MSRGGRRPGAGAPKGNRNALRHGRNSRDQALRYLLASIPRANRADVIRYIKAAGATPPPRNSIKRAPATPANIIPFSQRPHYINTQRTQSNDLELQLTALGFFGSRRFVALHPPETIDLVLTFLDDLDTKTIKSIRNTGALIRYLVHEELAELDGDRWLCPFCGAVHKPQEGDIAL